MARKDKPYLPLYVQDFMTDEKLMECSALATGVYVRIMCVLHKCEPYGTILLRQKDRQNERQIVNFAERFAKHLPYSSNVILDGLTELVAEGCLTIDGDALFQKRMVNDGKLSTKRSLAGSKGAEITNNKDDFAAAKVSANLSANADIDNESSISLNSGNGTWISEKKLFLNAEQWQYKQVGEYRISKNALVGYIDVFLKRIELQEDYKSEKELKKHCANWLRKNISADKTKALEEKRILPENYWTD